MAKTPIYHLSLDCISDVHVGCGTGVVGQFDSGQTIDSDGYPRIHGHFLKGVLKDASRDHLRSLCFLGEEPAELENAYRAHLSIFGPDHQLKSNDLGFDGEKHPDPAGHGIFIEDLIIPQGMRSTTSPEKHLILHSHTAINDTGLAKDKTLRTVQTIRKNTRLSGAVTLTNSEKHKYFKDLVESVRLLGGDKGRGYGRVKLSLEGDMEETVGIALPQIDPKQTFPCCLQVTLHNRAPIAIMDKGQAGNNMTTLEHIPGTTVFGALRSYLRESGNTFDFDPDSCSIGALYPLPIDLVDKQRIELTIPVPLSVQKAKSSHGLVADKPTLQPTWLTKTVSNRRDLLLSVGKDRGQDDGGVKFKGCSGYVTMIGDEFRFYSPKKTVRLRNEIKAGKRTVESGHLFNQELLEAGQYFRGYWWFKDQATLKTFLDTFELLLTNRLPLGLGRGRGWISFDTLRSVSTIDSIPTEQPGRSNNQTTSNQNKSTNGQNRLTITLTSPLIAWDEYLRPLSTLDPDTIERLTEVKGLTLDKNQDKSIAETDTLALFSLGGGMPSFPRQIISAGSCFSFTVNEDFDRTKLAELQHKGIGERTEEGFGRFMLDLKLHQPGVLDKNMPETDEELAIAVKTDEEIAIAVEKYLKLFKEVGKISASHWSTVMAWLEAGEEAFTLNWIIKQLKSNATKPSGQEWKDHKGIDLIEEITKQHVDDSARRILGLVARLAPVRRKREQDERRKQE